MKEQEIRPEKIFDEYLLLCKKDIDVFFGSDIEREFINCPACNGDGKPAFKKDGFQYRGCSTCKTIFVSPRPINKSFQVYYKDAPSTRFWADVFYKKTESARRKKMHRPKAELIFNSLKMKSISKQIIDIGGGFGVFAEEFYKLSKVKPIIIEPSDTLSKVSQKKRF